MFKKAKPNHPYESAEWLMDVEECLYRDLIELQWDWKQTYEGGRSVSGVPVLLKDGAITLADSKELTTIKGLSDPGIGYKSSFSITRWPKAQNTPYVKSIIDWAKSFNGSKISYSARHKTVKGILYTIEVGREEFGNYICSVRFKAFDTKTGECIYELNEQNKELKDYSFRRQVLKEILTKFPNCKLFIYPNLDSAELDFLGLSYRANSGWKELTPKNTSTQDSSSNYTDSLINDYED